MVLVSHDRHLLGACCDDFYLVADRRVEPFSGDLDDYRRLLVAMANAAASSSSGASASERQDRKEQRRQAADRRSALKPLRDKVKKLENQVEKLTAELAALDERLADSTLYEAAQRAKLTALLQQQGQVRQQLGEVESAWLEQAELLEQMESDE